MKVSKNPLTIPMYFREVSNKLLVKRMILLSISLLILLIPCYGIAASAFCTEQETLLCKQNVDIYFTLGRDSALGKSVGIVTPLKDQTFLVSESGNTCYHIDGAGNIIEQFTLNHHDVTGDGVHIKAGGQFGQTFVFAAYDYQRDCSYIAVTNPDGTIRYSGSIPAAINDTVLLDDGILLCGSAQAMDHASNRACVLPWAAKINSVGDIVWEYTEKAMPKMSRSFMHCVANSDACYFVCVEYDQDLRWSVLQLDINSLAIEETLLPLEQYQQYGSADIRETLLNGDDLLFLVSAYNEQGKKVDSILAIREEGLSWTHDIPEGCSVLSILDIDGGYACVSALMTETFSEIDLLFINNSGRLTRQIPFSYDDATQDERIVYLLSRLTQNEAGLWGVGSLFHSFLNMTSSCIFMVRFTFPSFFENTSNDNPILIC